MLDKSVEYEKKRVERELDDLELDCKMLIKRIAKVRSDLCKVKTDKDADAFTEKYNQFSFNEGLSMIKVYEVV